MREVVLKPSLKEFSCTKFYQFSGFLASLLATSSLSGILNGTLHSREHG